MVSYKVFLFYLDYSRSLSQRMLGPDESAHETVLRHHLIIEFPSMHNIGYLAIWLNSFTIQIKYSVR